MTNQQDNKKHKQEAENQNTLVKGVSIVADPLAKGILRQTYTVIDKNHVMNGLGQLFRWGKSINDASMETAHAPLVGKFVKVGGLQVAITALEAGYFITKGQNYEAFKAFASGSLSLGAGIACASHPIGWLACPMVASIVTRGVLSRFETKPIEFQVDIKKIIATAENMHSEFYSVKNIVIRHQLKIDPAIKDGDGNEDINHVMSDLVDIAFDNKNPNKKVKLSETYCKLIDALYVSKKIFADNQKQLIENSKKNCDDALTFETKTAFNMKVADFKFKPSISYDYNIIKSATKPISGLDSDKATHSCYQNENFSFNVNLRDYVDTDQNMLFDLTIGCISYDKILRVPVSYNWFDKTIIEIASKDQNFQSTLNKFCIIPTSIILGCGKNKYFEQKDIIKQNVNRNIRANKEDLDVVEQAIDLMYQEFNSGSVGYQSDECKILGYEIQYLCTF